MVNHPKSAMFFVKKMNNCLYDISLLALHRFLGSLGRCKPEMENGLSAYLSSAIFITFLDGLQIDIITMQIAKNSELSKMEWKLRFPHHQAVKIRNI